MITQGRRKHVCQLSCKYNLYIYIYIYEMDMDMDMVDHEDQFNSLLKHVG
jgi:hypothetical protein